MCTLKNPVRKADVLSFFALVIQATIIQQYSKNIKMPIPLQQPTKVLKCCDNQSFALLSVQTYLSCPFTNYNKKNKAGCGQPSCVTPCSNGTALYYSHKITKNSELLHIYYAHV